MKTFAATLALALISTAIAQENYAQWTGHQRIWLNTNTNGANISETVTNFPVLIRLTSAQTTVFAQAKAGGADLRFSKLDTVTALKYQIERFDSAAKLAEIWVLVDTLKPYSGTQGILMHWGRPTASDSSGGAAVFRTADGFQAVYHFNQDAAAPALDATANALSATPTAVTNAAGMIGPGKSFDGAASWYEVQNSAVGPVDFPQSSAYTVSAWINTAAAASGTHYEIVSKHDRQYALKIHSSSNYEFFEYNAGWNGVRSPAVIGEWKLVVGIANAGTYQMYVDGVLNPDPVVIASGSGSYAAGLTNLSIGKRGDNSTRFYNGLLDEVTLSSVARNAAWVKLSYENQRAAQTLVAFTQPTALKGAGGNANAAAASRASLRALDHGVLFQVQGDGRAARAALSILDTRGRAVWSRSPRTGAGMNASLWNGRADNGQEVASGLYIARVTVLDKDGRVIETLEKKIPFTR